MCLYFKMHISFSCLNYKLSWWETNFAMFLSFSRVKTLWSDLLCSLRNCLEIKFKIHLDSMWNNPKVSRTESNCLKIQWKYFIFVLMSNQLETILTNKIGIFFAYSCEYATAKESRMLIHFLCFRLIVNQCSKAWMNVILYFKNKFKCFRETEKKTAWVGITYICFIYRGMMKLQLQQHEQE